MASIAPFEDPRIGASTHGETGRWFAGLTRNGFVIVFVAALINATRRSTINLQVDLFDEWIVEWLQHFASSLLIGATMLLAVPFTANHYPVQGARQYAGSLWRSSIGIRLTGLDRCRRHRACLTYGFYDT